MEALDLNNQIINAAIASGSRTPDEIHNTILSL